MLGYTASFNVTRQSTKHICLLVACLSYLDIHFVFRRRAEYCDERVCPRAYLWNRRYELSQIFVRAKYDVARFSSGNVAVIICFRFCVWRHFPIMRPHPRRHDATAALAAASLRRRAHPCCVVWFVSCCCRVTTKLCSGGASYGRVSVCLSVCHKSEFYRNGWTTSVNSDF